MKPTLFRPTNPARLKAEANGRRSAQAAFDRVSAHGYEAADPAFREVGAILLTRWVQERGVPDEVREIWLAGALTQFYALIARRGRASRAAAATADPLARLRDFASGTIRKLGYSEAPSQLSPQHWQHVLTLVEARMRTRGIDLPEGWRKDLSAQFGRRGGDEPGR